MKTLIFATRPSALARWQTQFVIQALQHYHPGLECREEVITTQGDRRLDTPLPEMGGKGVFTQELEQALRQGAVQAAVHSLKDLPVEAAPDLVIGCIPPRGEVRDALVSAFGFTLDNLPPEARVGTSSVRRAAQLLHRRPDLTIVNLRGNVETRLRKAMAKEYDAIVLAGAGLARLGLLGHVSHWLPLDAMLPAPGQGALAVQCRADDQETLALLAALEDHGARRAVSAERAFLQGLGGGCAAPIAAYAQAVPNSPVVVLQGRALSPDGSQSKTITGKGEDPLELGTRLSQEIALSVSAWLEKEQHKNE
jgi:hydroxymethylbilane synthase